MNKLRAGVAALVVVSLPVALSWSCASSNKQVEPNVAATASASESSHAASASVASFDPRCAPPSASTIDAAAKTQLGQLGGEKESVSAPNDACEPGADNVARAEAEILAGANASTPLVAVKPWDRKTPPKFLELVGARFGLAAKEKALLAKNGFVVPSRLSAQGPAWALHEIYQSQMPLYVSIDAVMHAVFVSNDALIEGIESGELSPILDRTLLAMHCALPSAASAYPPEVARDLDLYLTVARKFLEGEAGKVKSAFGVDAEAQSLVERARKADEYDIAKGVMLFGRQRTIDFTQYKPRGHYASYGLEDYFRAAMWLSRLELNLVSRSCRSSQPDPSADRTETPREAVDALALEDLADRAHVEGDIALLDHAWAVLAGKREDVSIADLHALRMQAKIDKLEIPKSADALRLAIGDRFPRTVRFQYMPEGTTNDLPVIATFLGPRIVPDAAALRPIVQPAVPERTTVHVADVAYALGHDRAKTFLASDLEKYPTLGVQLEAARKIMQAKLTGEDLYSAWFSGIRALAEHPTGALPSFMNGDAFADMRVDSTVAAFGQIRHNYVLIAAQEYFAGGCEMPDAWVEPAPATYDALVDYADRVVALEGKLTKGAASAERMARTLRVLRIIQRHELEGHALTEPEKRWLSMVVEMYPATTGNPARFDGWYFDLFPSTTSALDGAEFIADFFTGTSVAYAGVAGTRLGLFVVDAGGPPRLMVGPVTRAYEHQAPLESVRLDDASALALKESERIAPWSKSYTLDSTTKEPSMTVQQEYPVATSEKLALSVTSKVGVGTVTLEILDHHRKPLASVTRNCGKGKTKFDFALPKDSYVEGIHVRVGTFQDWILAGPNDGAAKAYGGASFGGE